MKAVALVTKTPAFVQTTLAKRGLVHSVVTDIPRARMVRDRRVLIFLSLADALLFDRYRPRYGGVCVIIDSPLSFANYPMIRRLDFGFTPSRDVVLLRLPTNWPDRLTAVRNWRIIRRNANMIREVIQANSRDLFLAPYQTLMYSVTSKELRESMKRIIVEFLFRSRSGSHDKRLLELRMTLGRLCDARRQIKAQAAIVEVLRVLDTPFGVRFMGACAELMKVSARRGVVMEQVYKEVAAAHDVDDFDLRFLHIAHEKLASGHTS